MCQSRSSRGVFRTLAILGAAVVTSLPVNVAAQQSGPITLKDIEQAWRERGARFRSGRVAWKETKILARGGVHTEGDVAPFFRAKGPLPSQDLKHTFERELVFEGDRLRYTNNEPIWHEAVNDFWPGPFMSAFDGQLTTELDERPQASAFQRDGYVFPGGRSILSLLVLKPVLYHFSPEGDPIAYLKRCAITGQRERFDGSDCVVLAELSRRGPDDKQTTWLDAQRGFLVRRWVSRLGGAIVGQVDVFYRDDPQYGPLPKGWKRLEQTKEGVLRESIEAEVTRVELNVPIDPGEFRVQFPPGTLVVEQTIADGARQEQRSYILPDGTARPITMEEFRRRVPPEVLAATRPGEAGMPRPRRMEGWWTLTLAALGVVAIAVLTATGIRLRKRSRGAKR